MVEKMRFSSDLFDVEALFVEVLPFCVHVVFFNEVAFVHFLGLSQLQRDLLH